MVIHRTKDSIKEFNKTIFKMQGMINSVFRSVSYGKFKVISFAGYDKKYNRLYEIEFIETGVRKISRKCHILNGSVMDKLYDEDIKINSIHESNSSGKYKIISFVERKKPYSSKIYEIEFIETGYRCKVDKNCIRSGGIKDPLRPIIYGVGYIGSEYKKLRKNDIELWDAVHNRWFGIIGRCYNTIHKSYDSYGAKGVTVDNRWFCFSNFYKDIISLKGFNREKFISGDIVIDKDKKQMDIPYNERIYSKDTVTLITPKENSIYRKQIKLVNVQRLSPKGQ